MRVLFLLIFLLALPFAFAEDLADYPMLSVPVQVVMGTEHVGIHSLVAVDVMYSLAGYDKKQVFTRLDSEVTDFSSDFVLIGSPCQNSVVKHFYPEASCAMAEGIYYLEKDGHHVITLTAATDARLRQLGKYLRSGGLAGEFSSPFSDAIVAPVEGPVLHPDPTLAPAAPVDCSGCLSQGQCLSEGQVTSVQGEGYYCDDGVLKVQQGTGMCSIDAACLSGQCRDGACVPLTTVSSGFFGRILLWIKNIF